MSIANEITRLQNAKTSIKTSIENKGVIVGDGTIDTYASKINEISTSSAVLGTKTITENGTYKAIDDNLDGYSEVNVQLKGTEPQFTGHYDTEGLRQIGWTDEEIEYYNQNGVQWNSSEDNYFKLTQTELAGDDSKNTRFLPKSSTLTHFKNYNKLFAIPNINTNNNIGMSSMFQNCYSLTTIPQFDTSNKTNMNNMFQNCFSLTTIPQLDTNNVTDMSNMFSSCHSLITIPQLNTGKVINMDNMFSSCRSLITIPLLDTSKVTTMNNMFLECYSLKTIPQLNVSKVTNMHSMFSYCYSLKIIPLLDTSSVTNMSSMFNGCYSLITIPQLDTSSVIYMDSMFGNCYSLTMIPQLDTSSVTSIGNMFYNCSSPETLGGFLNLGQAYSTTSSANYSNYKLNLSTCTKLTEQSLINVLTNLYDIATKGCKTQQVILGSTNLAKLTSEEGQQALSNAQTKGWTVS